MNELKGFYYKSSEEVANFPAFHLYTNPGECDNGQRSQSFPQPWEIKTPEDWQSLDSMYIGVKLADGVDAKGRPVKNYRKAENFQASDCIVLDFDNEAAETEADEMTPEKLAEVFPRVAFAVEFSRHHNEPKHGAPARCRFHAVFPLGKTVTNYVYYDQYKKDAAALAPGADPGAKAAVQCTFLKQCGPDPRRAFHPGDLTILDLINARRAEVERWAIEIDKQEEAKRQQLKNVKEAEKEAKAWRRILDEIGAEDRTTTEAKAKTTRDATDTKSEGKAQRRAHAQEVETDEATSLEFENLAAWAKNSARAILSGSRPEPLPSDMSKEDQGRAHALTLLWMINPEDLPGLQPDDTASGAGCWLTCAAAAYNAGISYEDFDEWSEQDTREKDGRRRYNERENREHWQSFKRSAPGADTGALVGIVEHFHGKRYTFPRWQILNGLKFDPLEALRRASAEMSEEDKNNPATRWAWEQLQTFDNGRAKNNQFNAAVMLQSLEDVPDFCINELTHQINQRPKGKPGEPWRPLGDLDIYTYIDELGRVHGADFPKIKVSGAVCAMANLTKFNPLRAMFENLPEWDGVHRVNTLLADYLGAEPSEYHAALMRMHLAAAYVRAFHDFVFYKHMVILVGAQSIGKTGFIKMLSAPDLVGSRLYTSFDLDRIGEKDAKMQISGAWFVECAEMDGITSVTQGKLKDFVSSDSDDFRKPFGDTFEQHPRRCVLWGTSNQFSGLLRDSSGSTRYDPVFLPDVSGDELRELKKTLLNPYEATPETVAQIWAEVRECWQDWPEVSYNPKTQLFKIDLTEEMQREAEGMQAAASEESEALTLIREALDTPVPPDFIYWPYENMYDFYKVMQGYTPPGCSPEVIQAANRIRAAKESGKPVQVLPFFWAPLITRAIIGTPDRPHRKDREYREAVSALKGFEKTASPQITINLPGGGQRKISPYYRKK